jgi:two-component system sensor histidine kinase KdpD
MRVKTVTARVVASTASVALVTVVLLRLLSVNPTTVALTYLVLILLIATGWGIASSMAASVAAVLSFNFFFLPPVRTWTVDDPENWVAFVAFLVTAVVASQLSGRARQQTIDALDRQRDLERLYALSRSLLLSGHAEVGPATIARHIADTFDLAAVALYDVTTDVVGLGGSSELRGIDTRLRDVARQAISVRESSGVTISAIRLGGTPIASLALSANPLSDTVLQSIGNLVAIALERERGRQTAARAEAARQSGELRATILDALAHEFKTPLTSLKVAASALRAEAPRPAHDQELLAIVDEETTRLDRLVTDVVQMLRIDAGDFVVRRARHRVSDTVRAALDEIGHRLDGHRVVDRVPRDLEFTADADLVGLALRQLIDNAVKYSPPSSTIELDAQADKAVTISVRNSGSAIPHRELAKVFERFYRGTTAGQVAGTGMGLSIVQQIARAHGGTLTARSSADAGTEFAISLPLEPA